MISLEERERIIYDVRDELSDLVSASVFREVDVRMPTKDGEFLQIAYRNERDVRNPYVVFVKGKIEAGALVEIHNECVGDLFKSTVCGCREELESSLETIGKE